MSQILIVEDDEGCRTLLGAVVQHYGFTPAYADDGDSALSRLRWADGHLVLVLDLLLPGRNGFEILRELKCTNPGLLRRTIVVTAASHRTLSGCDELGLVRHLFRKPLDVEEFGAELLACAADA